MSDYVDYAPRLDGATIDVAATDGEVTSLTLYSNPARSGTAVATVGPAVRVVAGWYRFTVPGNTPPGRYWTEIVWRTSPTALPFRDVGDRVDLPYDSELVCSPEDLATRLDIPLPITPEQREILRDAIIDAQADVELELNRTIVARLQTLTAVEPALGVTDLMLSTSWPDTADFDDKVTVLDYAADVDGTYTLTVLVGLDGRNTPAIRRFVIAHAAELVRRNPSNDMGTRQVTSLSAEGQSITYESDTTIGAIGTVPARSTLARYKRYAAYRRATSPALAWPYS